MFDEGGRHKPERGSVERITVATGHSFDELVSALEQELGHLDTSWGSAIASTEAPLRELCSVFEAMSGRHGLLMFLRDGGAVANSCHGMRRHCTFYLVGNPPLPPEVIGTDLAVGIFVPFRLDIREGDGGTFISYDRVSSSLAMLGTAALEAIGASLDRKIARLARIMSGSARPHADRA